MLSIQYASCFKFRSINIQSKVSWLSLFADASNMCAQTVFNVFDHLTAWADGKSKAAAVRRVKGVPHKGEFCNFVCRKYVLPVIH